MVSHHRASRHARQVVALSAAAILVACTTTPNVSEIGLDPAKRMLTGPDAERTPDGLVLVLTPEFPGRLYARVPRPHLERYKRINLAATSIRYKDAGGRWSRSDEERVSQHFETALHRELGGKGGWTLTDEMGPDVLLVTVSAIDLDIRTNEPPGSRSRFVATAGEVVLVLELSDSVTHEPLMRFLERRALPGGYFSGAEVDIKRHGRAFSRFAADLGDNLDNYYAASHAIEQEEAAKRATAAPE